MHTRYIEYTDILESVSFAQHPGGSDCESRQYRCFLKRNDFRLDLKVGIIIIIMDISMAHDP